MPAINIHPQSHAPLPPDGDFTRAGLGPSSTGLHPGHVVAGNRVVRETMRATNEWFDGSREAHVERSAVGLERQGWPPPGAEVESGIFSD